MRFCYWYYDITVLCFQGSLTVYSQLYIVISYCNDKAVMMIIKIPFSGKFFSGIKFHILLASNIIIIHKLMCIFMDFLWSYFSIWKF